MFPYGFWESDLWKEAARAGLRQISKMVSQGNIAGASSLATTPGVLKPSAAGSQIKQLGRGSEGLATMVAHPEHGVAVRKLYDPRGLSSPAMIQRKEEAGRALGDNPNFSKFLGSAPTPHGGGQMHFNEFVPSTQQKPSILNTPASMRAKTEQSLAASNTGRSARAALENVGYEGHDIRKGNMMTDARTGQNKVIDYMPARPGEMATLDSSRPNNITVSQAGASLFNTSRNQSTTKGMLGHMLGGNKPMGVRRNVGVPGTGTLINGGVGDAPMQRAPANFAPKPNTQLGHASAPGAVAPPSSSANTSVMASPAPAIKPPKPDLPKPASSEQATSVIKGPKPVQAITPGLQ